MALVSTEERKCIDEINKGGRKISQVQNKAFQGCIKLYQKDILPQTLAECLPEGFPPKVTLNVEKVEAKADKVCGGVPPSFGGSSIDGQTDVAIQASFDLLEDLFGPAPIEAAVSTTDATAKCQQTMLKDLHKCHDTRLKTYRKCVLDGLKFGSIQDEIGMELLCLQAADQTEPRGKIAANCSSKPTGHVSGRCLNQGVALDTAFPGCNTTDGANLVSCMDAAARCRLCNFAVEVNNLLTDCDEYDDGSENLSCVTPNICGDGTILEAEACDDGNRTSGDGCDSSCQIETGFDCLGEPSTCSEICGDGLIVGGETCDDGGTTSGDGCDSSCQIETGFDCLGEPSTCSEVCGDGLIVGGEACDDTNTNPGDGCDAACQVESGYACSGLPSTCSEVCGDGLIVGSETCDDTNTNPGDGCDAACQVESGYACSGLPSICGEVCGDGLIIGGEACDDGGTTSGDGCDASCQLEPGFNCGSGAPTVCTNICGDGLVVAGETCDDTNTTPGDGCDASCQVETGYACPGEPSVCAPVCGDGLVILPETCDDLGSATGDGCDDVCQVEAGWACTGQPSGCNLFTVVINTPTNGSFTTDPTVSVTGVVNFLDPSQAALTINGDPVTVAPGGTFSTTVTLDQSAIFTPIRATVTDTAFGGNAHDRVVAIFGPSVADGALSDESIALRLQDSGLDEAEPLVAQLAGGGLDLATLIPVGTVLIDDQCFIDTFVGCGGSASVVVASPAPSIDDFGIAIDSQNGFVEGDVTVFGLEVNVQINGSGLVPTCGLRITAASGTFFGDYTLQPDPSDPNVMDVNQTGSLGVSFANFNDEFTSGLCDAPIIGSIIGLFLPDIQNLTTDAIRDFLQDPDGNGPQDGPIADAIETALGQLNITSSIGQGLDVQIDTPIFDVLEDTNGITVGTDSSFTVSVGSDPGQCQPPPGAPDLTESLAITQAFPTFGALTPGTGQPYDFGLCISSEGFNQLLRVQVECGLLVTSITELDLGGGTVPITSGILSLLIPQFSVFPPSTPFRIDLKPELAPVVSGDGPSGELTELKIAQLIANIVQNDGSETIVLSGAFDATVGLELEFAPDGIGFILSEPEPGAITVAILQNPLGVDEPNLETTVLPPLVTTLLPELTSALETIALPDFLGLDIDGVEVSKNGEFLSLFANLNPPAP